ncbi:MAG: hemolysin III family protein [Bacteroidia bacterium]|nr:hemolysin III family protein [Bacteroidia bacterium]
MELTYLREEKLNAWSHGLGVVLSIPALVILLLQYSGSAQYGTFALIVYGISLFLLFSASTLYHLASQPKLKRQLRILDHISIYMLIAGTYTPVALIKLVDGNGWIIFSIVWLIALVGSVLKLFFTGKYEIFSLGLYLIMGWLIVFDLQNLLSSSSALGIFLLALGGFCYTFGILFYTWKRIPHHHLIWHFFVLAGAISHWYYIFLDVI